jgi:hypothetical protein
MSGANRASISVEGDIPRSVQNADALWQYSPAIANPRRKAGIDS